MSSVFVDTSGILALTIRRRGIEEAFAYDPDFGEEGFLPVT